MQKIHTIENIDTTVKENTKSKKFLIQNIQGIQDTVRRPNLWIIGVDELQEDTTKQVMELNKPIQDLKREVDTVKKTQSEETMETEILGKKSGTIDASINNRIQEMEERISGAEDSIGNMDTAIKENAKCKKILTQNIQEIQDTMRRPT